MKWLGSLFALACLTTNALADTLCDTPAREQALIEEMQHEEAFKTLIGAGCFNSGQNAKHFLAVSGMLPTVETELERGENISRALTYVVTAARAEIDAGTPETRRWQQIFDKATFMKIVVDQALFDRSYGADGTVLADVFNTDEFRLANDGRAALVGDLTSPIGATCQPGAACPAFETAKAIAGLLSAGQAIVRASGNGTALAQLADSRLALKKWDSYFNDAHFQWWWEVWANGLAMDCDQNDEQVGRQGFCDVPNSQWIIMHPDVGLNWSSSAAGVNDLQPSFFVEVLGRNWWQWKEDGTIAKARGFSVVVAHTDLQQTGNWGIGLMYHHNNAMSVSVVSTDGETGVMVSADLAKFVFGRKEKYKSYLQSAKKPAFWTEVLLD